MQERVYQNRFSIWAGPVNNNSGISFKKKFITNTQQKKFNQTYKKLCIFLDFFKNESAPALLKVYNH